jgi:hypothetical protein
MESIYTRDPDIAIWICNGGFVMKSLRVEVQPEGGVAVGVREMVAGSKEVILAQISRLIDEDSSSRKEFDDWGEGDV